MKFTHCLNKAFSLQHSRQAAYCLHDVTLLPRNSHFVLTFVKVNISTIFADWRHCLRHTNSTNSLAFQAFSMTLFNGIIPKCKNSIITHVCFIALTFARPLWRCLNTRPTASCSNNFLGTWQINMGDPYNIHWAEKSSNQIKYITLCDWSGDSVDVTIALASASTSFSEKYIISGQWMHLL